LKLLSFPNFDFFCFFVQKGCGIGEAGIKALAEALKVNQALQQLDLRANGIADEVTHIASALAVNSTLLQIDLGGMTSSSLWMMLTTHCFQEMRLTVMEQLQWQRP
jgi:hypothetical protein